MFLSAPLSSFFFLYPYGFWFYLPFFHVLSAFFVAVLCCLNSTIWRSYSPCIRYPFRLPVLFVHDVMPPCIYMIWYSSAGTRWFQTSDSSCMTWSWHSIWDGWSFISWTIRWFDHPSKTVTAINNRSKWVINCIVYAQNHLQKWSRLLGPLYLTSKIAKRSSPKRIRIPCYSSPLFSNTWSSPCHNKIA
jgi:hypothetical protein